MFFSNIISGFYKMIFVEIKLILKKLSWSFGGEGIELVNSFQSGNTLRHMSSYQQFFGRIFQVRNNCFYLVRSVVILSCSSVFLKKKSKLKW